MSEYVFTNNAVGYLSAQIGAGDTSFSLTSGGGNSFPSLTVGGGQVFAVLVENDSTKEFMVCAVKAGDQFSVTRASTAYAFPAGAKVTLVADATCLGNFLQKGVFRTVTSDPDGSLVAAYTGEEVYQSASSKWWKHVTATTWLRQNT